MDTTATWFEAIESRGELGQFYHLFGSVKSRAEWLATRSDHEQFALITRKWSGEHFQGILTNNRIRIHSVT